MPGPAFLMRLVLLGDLGFGAALVAETDLGHAHPRARALLGEVKSHQ
ncbi:Uncharacterised protein [Mycobacteroides abscessus]|nr:Uncharacterised protein [Mycobacteroides abscessus]